MNMTELSLPKFIKLLQDCGAQACVARFVSRKV